MVLDVILLLLLAGAVWKGWSSGAITMLLSLAILIVAGFLASAFGTRVGELLSVGPSYARPVIGFVVIFLALLILGSFVKKMFKPTRGVLRGMDALIGGCIGLIRGAFILSILLILMKLVHLPPEKITEKSVLYPIVLKTSTSVIGVLRPYVSEHVASIMV